MEQVKGRFYYLMVLFRLMIDPTSVLYMKEYYTPLYEKFRNALDRFKKYTVSR